MGSIDAVRPLPARFQGVEPLFHLLEGDERLRRGSPRRVVDGKPRTLPSHREVAAGPGQRPGESQPTQSVRVSVGAVGSEGAVDDRVGVLPAVPQQVQPDRAMLGRAGSVLEWSVTGQRGRSAGVRTQHDLCGEASAGVSGRSALRQRGVSKHERDETTGAVPSTTPRPGEVVCHHSTPQTGRIIFLNPPNPKWSCP